MKINKPWAAILLGLINLIVLFILGTLMHGFLGAGARDWFENLFVLCMLSAAYYLILPDWDNE